jgi:hypothetical protein
MIILIKIIKIILNHLKEDQHPKKIDKVCNHFILIFKTLRVKIWYNSILTEIEEQTILKMSMVEIIMII